MHATTSTAMAFQKRIFCVQKLRLQQTLRERGVGQDRIDHASAPVDLVARQIRIGSFFGLLAHAN